ncbi:putative mediator of RNA polymerase II transcription subunit 12 [Stegodyphus dumicola]|uniref:putative mediator of RNA polymerase II transcription subunit 12 n=1 Tax=Stegodyphus dumicola TaxID=202533 RepID=UPI0015AAE6F3|nr:putative mediator of RNA polymerase II transcription subunit 12 [Stegodyphus dumicola]
MGSIKQLFLVILFIGLATADDRKKRQASYGAPYDGNYGGAAAYRQPHQQPQPHQQQAYQPPQAQSYGGHQQVQQYPAQAARPVRQHAPDEEEKDEGPHPLQLLLEKSKFDCAGKSDGYYADSDVGCQAFHYCVSGQKHSMHCPEGTVFHQVHLNCVPNDQDICSKANKFYFVNDYLNKPLEQRGPNNTIQYHQRYYPENYAVGDPFIPPQEAQTSQREPPAATYGLGPAYREQAPAVSHQQQAAPVHRPQQPAPYSPPQQQVYAAQHRPAYQQQQPAHRPAAYQQQVAARPVAHQAQAAPRPVPYQQAPQVALYGYGAEQERAHQAQALQAQRAYAQQQYQAVAPHQQQYAAGAQQQYAAGAVPRSRYNQQY